MEPHGFRNLVNAVNKLTFMPTLGDNNMTLTCVANKSEQERLETVSVTLNVSCESYVFRQIYTKCSFSIIPLESRRNYLIPYNMLAKRVCTFLHDISMQF